MQAPEFIANVFRGRINFRTIVASYTISVSMLTALDLASGTKSTMSDTLAGSVVMTPIVLLPEVAVPIILTGYVTGGVIDYMSKRK
jgi:hypothetical protein